MLADTGIPSQSDNTHVIDARLQRYLPKSGWSAREKIISSLQIAFEQSPVVLLYGENGGGKTTSAAAFAIQEVSRGSLTGNPVLYSSFQEVENLTDLLESFGWVYEIALLERNIDWRTLEDFQRFKLVQDVLKKVHLLWIWDDFELAGIEARKWNKDERHQVVELLQSIPQGGGKILILSERQEQNQLGEIPMRVPMALDGENPLAQKIASHLAQAGISVEPHLSKIILQVMAQFSEKDQKIIHLMGLFKGILNLEIIHGMADKKNRWCYSDLAGVDIEDIKVLFNQVAEYRLCAPISSTGYYLLQPAFTAWLIKQMNPGMVRYAQRAFTQSMANFARQSVNTVQEGNHEVIDLLAVHEPNLRQSLVLANRFRWRRVIIDLLSALRWVFLKSRRYASWNRLLDQVIRNFFHPDSLQPVSRRDRLANDLATFQVEISLKRNRYTQAARWQSLIVTAEREESSGRKKTDSSVSEKSSISRELVNALIGLGEIYRQVVSPKSIEAYIEAYRYAKEIGETGLAGDVASRIAEAYLAIPVAQNFAHAETWIQTGLETAGEQNDRLIGRLTALRGKAAYENFLKAQKANKPVNELVDLLNQALDYSFQALDLVSEKDLAESGRLHEMIGLLYLQSEGMLETAVEFYDRAIDEMTRGGDKSGAARAGHNLAIPLFLLNDFDRSHQYAQAALQTYEELGADVVVEAQKVRRFLTRFPVENHA